MQGGGEGISVKLAWNGPASLVRRTTFVAIALALFCREASAQSLQELGRLSLEELANVEITSVSKRAEPLGEAAAAVYVITGDEIRRSGVASLPEALRLAPNLEVARVNSQSYAISARGLNSVNASNKLLVLIDGRSLYTPFFSSVFWDQQTLLMADIERIEVISGPGGTLWGANAVNGVVNIITRRSSETQGGVVDAKVGDFDQRVAVRWGGRLGDAGSYRIYALGFGEGNTDLAGDGSAMDKWRGRQAGFRSDVAALDGTLTFQGDLYENLIDTPSGRRSGGDLLGRWTRTLASGGGVELQAYYDEQNRSDSGTPAGTSFNRVKTLDLQGQHSFLLDRNQQIVWGAGYRTWRDEFQNTTNPFVLMPPSETLHLGNVFAQDTIALRDDLKLVLGAKVEYNTFSRWAFMPNARLGWRADPRNFLWLAVSRAVRPPSRLERDLTAPGIVDTSPDFQSEKLIAYEAGWRSQLRSDVTVSVSAFYNRYDDLRTTSPNPVTVLPVTFGNGWEGHAQGVDVWASYSPFPWWRIDPGFELLRKDFHLKPGQADIAGIQTVLGHDPGHQIFVRSYMDLPHDMDLYVALRQIGALPDISVPSYFEADVRLAWHVTRTLELALVGQNLVHARHAETTAPPVHEIPRSFYVGLRWSF
jgi:iron complex outermembrane receptor protein